MRLITLGAMTVWALLAAMPAAAQVTAQVSTTQDTPMDHEWVATGFVGPTFGDSVDSTDTGFGGTFAYLYRRTIGAELIADFTPDFGFADGQAVDSAVNNYMANVIAAAPLGADGQFQPFVSGGLGAMRLHADVPSSTGGLVDVEDTQLGTNVGAGVMLFRDRWGVRTDIRYFQGLTGDDDEDLVDPLDPSDILGDTNFWRYNVGVVYRW